MLTSIWAIIGSGNGLLPDNLTWDIWLRTTSQNMAEPSIIKTSLKITYLKFHSNLPGTNVLMDIKAYSFRRLQSWGMGCHYWLVQQSINSFWPSDTIWLHISGSTLVQVMTCCLMAPRHYLNQRSLIISEVPWHEPERNFTVINQAHIL